jgi:hypothetical protein
METAIKNINNYNNKFQIITNLISKNPKKVKIKLTNCFWHTN